LADLIVSIRNETPPKPSTLQSGVDDQLEAICLKCMARETEDRFQTADELSVALNEYQQDIAAQSHDENRDRLTRRAVIKLCTTVAFVLLAGVTIFLRTGEGTVEIEIDDKSSTLLVDGKAVKVESGAVSVSVGRHENRRIWLDLNTDGLLDANEPRQNTDELGEFRFAGLRGEEAPAFCHDSHARNRAGARTATDPRGRTFCSGHDALGQFQFPAWQIPDSEPTIHSAD
jgi:hypothetical protein